jgi:hypothetical protein
VAERADCSREPLGDVVGRALGDRVEVIWEGWWRSALRGLAEVPRDILGSRAARGFEVV